MTFMSLFSGVGGMDIGFPKDWQCVGFSEIDKYASMVLKYHFPNIKNYGNITTIRTDELPDFDMLAGGSPCQDFSIAGKRRGLAGAKSSLAWEYIRILRDKKPRYFIWENVKGTLSSRNGWDFANLISAFSESGYNLWWQVLNAKNFGVPQNRERIFVVGFRDQYPPEVFFESKDTRPIADVGTTKPNDRIGQHDRVFGTDGIIGALGAVDYKQPPQILVKNKGESQHYRLYDENGLAPTLQSQSGMSSQKHPFIFAQRGRNSQNPKSRKSGLPTEQMFEPNLEGIANTLTSVEKDNYVFDKQVRKLLPIECERLMSWPDDWTRYGIDEKENTIEISDSQRYKMCGNGVVSNVVKTLVETLL